MIRADSSVARNWSDWGFTVKQGGRTVHEDSGAHRITTSSLTMEVEALTRAIQWLASQCDALVTQAIILTDTLNSLPKVETGMSCPDWLARSYAQRLVGMPESVGMNWQIDWQAQQTSHLVCSLAGQRCLDA